MRRCEQRLLVLKLQQELRLSECCSSVWEVATSQSSCFAQDTVGLIIGLDVVRASLARWYLEQDGVLLSCRDKVQELGAAAQALPALFGPGLQT